MAGQFYRPHICQLAVRDVELAIGVDTDRDGKVTWGELRANAPRLLQYVGQHLFLAAQDGNCVLNLGAIRINERVDGKHQRVQAVVFMEDFPRSTAGKTLKREMREPYWAGRAARI